MSSTLTRKKDSTTSLRPNTGRGSFWIIFLLVSFFSLLKIAAQTTTVPEYSWLSETAMKTVTVADNNYQDLTIAVATDQQGFVYTLTLGRGIQKRNPDGSVLNASFIAADKMDEPLDIAIDKEGFIYVADFLPEGETHMDNGRIKVFDPQGNQVNMILTDYYRPLGLDIAGENIYVAEYHDGQNGSVTQVQSRIRIYNKISGAVIKETSLVQLPYRIAVDSGKNVYVSQDGNGIPAVLIFNQDLVYLNSLPNIISPGSIVIDAFDFIHVIEYAGRIHFSTFINFKNLTTEELLKLSNEIYQGQKNEDFVIKIFNPSRTFEKSLVNKLDFPVDLAFNRCDRLYVNNAEIFGTPWIFFIPDRLEFDLEIYRRTPTFDLAEAPVVLTCPGNITVAAEEGKNFAVVNYTNPTFSDNCGAFNLTRTGPASGSEFPVGTTVVEFTATDSAGNKSICSFTVIVEAADPPLDITCPADQSGELNESCEFTVPDYKNLAQVNFQDAVITQDPPVGTVITENKSITLTASRDGKTDSCSFMLNLTDPIFPKINCPAEQEVTFTPGVGYTLPDYLADSGASDNCTVAEVTQEPVAGTVIFEDTQVTLNVIDNYGNTSKCQFLVLATQEAALEITCPGNQTGELYASCEFVVPNYTGLGSVNYENAVITQFPEAGTIVSENTEVILTATMGDQTDSCSFMLILTDGIAPEITCPGDQTENYDPATGLTLKDYRNLATSSDNCGAPEITQNPAPGTVVNSNTQITLTATDISRNSTSCTFMVLLSEEEVLEITCPADTMEALGDNCGFTLPDYTNSATVNFEGAQISQSPAAGTIISQTTIIILTATYEGKTDTCSFNISLEDSTAPIGSCVVGIGFRLDQNGTLTITPEQINAGSADNCGIVNMELDKTTFNTSNLGDNTVTLTVTDAAGNKDSCRSVVTIWPYEGSGSDFSCKSRVVLELDDSGNAGLNVSELYSGDPGARRFTLSKTSFTCVDTGENTVTLNFTDGQNSGSCDIIVEVRDTKPPVIQVRNLLISLDDTGQAFITADMFNTGTSDNCGEFSLRIDKTIFGCKDIGNNPVTFSATDVNGNSASVNVFVTVLGNCEEPGPGLDFIYIYPNPTTGPISFAIPEGISLTKVEVFDFRGRFIMYKDFPENTITYEIDLTGVLQAIYFVRLYTKDENILLRVIKD